MRGQSMLRRLLLPCLLWLMPLAPALAQDADPEAGAVWLKVRAELFGDAAIASDDGVIALEAPARAQDASAVPISIRAAFAQGPQRSIDRVWLIVDDNPSPVAAVFRFTRASGRADIDTRIRVEQ